MLSLGGGKTNEAVLMLDNQGKFPLYDVTVEITDSAKRQAAIKSLGLGSGLVPVTPNELRELGQAKVTLPPRNLRPNQSVILRNPWPLPADKDAIEYGIEIFARNWIFLQQIKLQRVNGFWRQAGRVFKDSGVGKKNIFLREWADPEFPRNERGKVVW